jgi:hypothetical protein
MNILVFTYLLLQLFMITNAWREMRKAMMAHEIDVASKKVYGVDLP